MSFSPKKADRGRTKVARTVGRIMGMVFLVASVGSQLWMWYTLVGPAPKETWKTVYIVLAFPFIWGMFGSGMAIIEANAEEVT